MMWIFFGTRHGKGPHDGVRVVLKRFFKKIQLYVNGPKLQNAKDVVNLLDTHLSSRSKTSYKKERKFVTQKNLHVKTIDVDHQTKYICGFVKGT
jgi:hypothetical protein